MRDGKQMQWSPWLLTALRGSRPWPRRQGTQVESGELLELRKRELTVRKSRVHWMGIRRGRTALRKWFWRTSVACWPVHVRKEITWKEPVNVRGKSNQPQGWKPCLFLSPRLETSRFIVIGQSAQKEPCLSHGEYLARVWKLTWPSLGNLKSNTEKRKKTKSNWFK